MKTEEVTEFDRGGKLGYLCQSVSELNGDGLGVRKPNEKGPRGKKGTKRKGRRAK